MVVFTATFSTLLVINSSDDWEYLRVFCDETFRNSKESSLVSGIVSNKNIVDPESGFVIYNVEYQSKRNHWSFG